MKPNILVLAAGQVTFETHDGGYPLCLTEMDGKSLLERIILNTGDITRSNYAFALLDKDAQRFHLDKVVNLLVPGASVIRIPESTQGSACTALLAASKLNPEGELLIISANEYVDLNFSDVMADFRSRGLDGGTLIFRSVHPRYSYVRLSPDGLVTEAAQQNPISQHATAGVFWFASTGEFVNAAKSMIRKNATVGGKFFVAPVYNELILKQGKVGIIEIDIGKYQPLKSEQQVHQFEQGAST